MNHYARLSHVKTDVAGVTGTTLDATYLRAIDAESRSFERECGGRYFYTQVATRYYDGNGQTRLWFPDYADVISVTSLKFDEDGDGTYELTLTEGADFYLWPDNTTPKRRIDLDLNHGQRGSFPVGRRKVEVVGKFGYSEEWELVGTKATGITSADGTTADMSAGHTVEAGDVIKVDDEQLYVSAVAANTLTLTRAINGTTAAAHSNGVSVYVRRYPRDIEEIIRERVVQGRWNNNQGMPIGDPVANGIDFAEYQRVIGHYRFKVVV